MKNKLLKVAGVVIMAGFVAGVARATPITPELTLLINGSTTGTSSPNPITSPVNGSTININNAYNVGVFTISGFGTLANASTVTPLLDLDTLTLTTSGTGTLTVELLYSGFTTPSGITLTGGNNGAMSGTTGAIQWAFTSDLDSGNGIGLLLTLNSSGADSTPVSLDGSLSVPDGGTTAMLLGLALGGLGLLRMRNKLRRA